MTKKKKNETLLDKIKFSFDKVMLGNIILEILFLVLGVVLYFNPYMAIHTAGIVLGIVFILFGIFNIYEFLLRGETPLFTWDIVLGILTIILGILTIADPFKIAKFLTLFLGIYLIVSALFRVVTAFKLKKYGFDGWKLILVVSILILIFGVFIAINPMAYVEIVEAAGIFIVLASILELCELIMLYSRAKDIMKLIKENI